MEYESEIKKLEILLAEKRYFELISIGVQFINFFSDKLNEQYDINEISSHDIIELESHTGIGFKDWKIVKKEILKSLRSDDSWKYKILGILDEILNASLPPYIEVTPDLIVKIRSVHKFRNTLQHDYYKNEISIKELEIKSKECLEICKLFKQFSKNGYFDR